MSKRRRQSQELQPEREGGGRGWGGGRGRARLTIQSGLPVGSHSQEGLGEDPGQMRKERRASAAAWSLDPRPSTDPGPGLSRPKQPVNKPTSSLPPAPLLRRPLRALGIAAGGCSNGTPWPPRGAVPAPASGAPGPSAARPARAAMRADSPRLPGGGGTSAPSGGGGHVGPGHVTAAVARPG